MVEIPVVKRVPAHLTAPCRAPAYTGQTNADLLGYALDLKGALAECNSRMAAIRDASR